MTHTFKLAARRDYFMRTTWRRFHCDRCMDHAVEHAYGVPAFNVNNLEQVQAIMQTTSGCDRPVIMQASAGARKFAREAFLRHLVEAAVETYPDIPVVMHQDHGASLAVCQAAIRSGFSSVMMDGSLMPDMKTVRPTTTT